MSAAEHAGITVAVIHEQNLVIETLWQVVAADPRLTLAGTARESGAGMELIRATRPAVALVAARIYQGDSFVMPSPATDGETPTQVLLLAGCATPDVIKAALGNGAVGCVIKTASSQEVVEAIVAAADGGAYESPGAICGGAEPVGGRALLSARERNTLALASQGLRVKQIAQELGVSVSTVSTFMTRGREKLGASTVAGAVAEAIRQGYLD